MNYFPTKSSYNEMNFAGTNTNSSRNIAIFMLLRLSNLKYNKLATKRVFFMLLVLFLYYTVDLMISLLLIILGWN